jgi:hypothetical protein
MSAIDFNKQAHANRMQMLGWVRQNKALSDTERLRHLRLIAGSGSVLRQITNARRAKLARGAA